MSLVDIDRLEALLIDAARSQRTLTYGEVLAHFEKRVAPRLVFALCRDLSDVYRRTEARGEPDLCALVVRKSDGLPGAGFFRSAWADGTYDGPATGPSARQYLRACQEAVFAHFAPPRDPSSSS